MRHAFPVLLATKQGDMGETQGGGDYCCFLSSVSLKQRFTVETVVVVGLFVGDL